MLNFSKNSLQMCANIMPFNFNLTISQRKAGQNIIIHQDTYVYIHKRYIHIVKPLCPYGIKIKQNEFNKYSAHYYVNGKILGAEKTITEHTSHISFGDIRFLCKLRGSLSWVELSLNLEQAYGIVLKSHPNTTSKQFPITKLRA